ncbi:unnamed protein product [Musa hybrid cultivar]
MFLVVKLMDSKASGFLNYSGRQKRQLKADDKSISTNELVRSVAAVLEKTDKWDVLLNDLCAASASGITPSVAVQVLKGIKKPDIAFKYFEWLDNLQGFEHDSLT